MKRNLTLFILMSLTAMIILSGCLESSNSNNTNNNSETLYKEKIIGSWYFSGQGQIINTSENTSILIIYIFYSNSSFFTAAKVGNKSDYQDKRWGIYEINDNTIFFNYTNNVNISNSYLYYEFSEEYNNLILYYKDSEGHETHITFTRSYSIQ